MLNFEYRYGDVNYILIFSLINKETKHNNLFHLLYLYIIKQAKYIIYFY